MKGLKRLSVAELMRRERLYSKFEMLDEKTEQVRKELEKRKTNV